MKAYLELKNIFQQYAHLQHVAAICQWDEAVMMPSGGGEARAQALATLRTMSHQLLTQPHLQDLLQQALQEDLTLPWDVSNLQLMLRAIKSKNCLPSDLVKHSTLAFLRCEQAWRYLRPKNDWATFLPLLEENVALIKDIAQCRAQMLGCDAYDAMLELYSPGVSQQLINPLFATLQEKLPAMIQQRMSMQLPPPSLAGNYSLQSQRDLGVAVMKLLGFDFNGGRLDISHHPFCGGVPQDIRVTTRYQAHEFLPSLMGICHETGHALYERGLPREWLDQPVGQALGMAVHESQSLLIEMQICHGLPFLTYLLPLIHNHLKVKSPLTAEQLYQRMTQVRPGYIRVDADELCYPLHIVLRYDIERLLLADKIKVKELPEFWDQYMRKFFNISTKDNYTDGVMQDVHWSSGNFGYFPDYTLGAIIAAQLLAALVRDYPQIHQDIATGKFDNLQDWLRQHVHSKGSLLSLPELMQQATGTPLAVDSFMEHLQKRYINVSI